MSTRQKLVALVSAPCAALLLTQLPKFEGTVLRGYRDPIGVVTACTGHTKSAVLGRPYTPAECDALLVDDLVDKAAAVLQCTPVLQGQTYRLAAATSFAFNVGITAYCGSTTARRFNAGDYAGACKALNESDTGKPQWVTARGKPLPGLVKRRAIERQLCEGKLDVPA
jgi:lysozyme